MSERTDLLRAMHKARKEGNLQTFLNDLTEERFAIIKQNLHGETAHRVSSTLVTSLEGEEFLDSVSERVNKDHFKAYRAWQEKLGKLPKKSLDSIEETTQDIINLIQQKFDPVGTDDQIENDRIYGLVVGYVQSGKTAHFSGLISRAVDEGFTFIIVLSGILNDLRRQTQLRLHKDVFGTDGIKAHKPMSTISPPSASKFRFLTDLDSDIGSGEFTIIDDDMKQVLESDEVLVAITKKNTSVLQHLLNGIANAADSTKREHKVLIIDDEADHATINTGGEGEEPFTDPTLEGEDEEDPTDDDSDPSKTNLLVRKIIQQFPRTAYIGYTATPYANVLIDPFLKTEELGLSLYPRDFILNLSKPDDYFGAERFFGTDGDEEGIHVILHPEDTAVEIMQVEMNVETNIQDLVPPGLQEAMLDFVLTGAVKHHRRQQGVSIQSLHHSMLVHVSRLNEDQSAIHAMIGKLIDLWKVQASSMFEKEDFLEILRNRWKAEFQSKYPDIETFDEFSNVIVDDDGWIQSVEVMMINSKSDEMLDYDAYEDGLNVIAIGGNKLSRGLTLEGLTVSMYMRKTRMYDSLMQMGRWFGYRQGYEDLVRVHTTEHLYSWFEWLVKAEDAVRRDIDRYAMLGVSPVDVAVRIPWHDELMPTARNKMKYAIKNIYNYSNRTTESIHLPMNEPARLQANLSATQTFFASLAAPVPFLKRGYAWANVAKELVIDFLRQIDLPGPPNAAFDTVGLIRFLEKTDAIETITVAHAGRDWTAISTTQTTPPSAPLPHSMKPRYVGRSQIGIKGEGTGNIRAISDPQDREGVRELAPDQPSLIVYFVAPGSKTSSSTRENLPEGTTPIVGLALRFPETEGPLSDVRAAVTVRGLRGDLNE
jgi:hypothetical protein